MSVQIPVQRCETVVPKAFMVDDAGPVLVATPILIWYDGQADTQFPTHDPCGEYSMTITHADPRGAIYVR